MSDAAGNVTPAHSRSRARTVGGLGSQRRALANVRPARLASILTAQQEPDQACDFAADVLNATQSLGSYLVISQLI
ncbi:MAG: hypothetical protein ACRDNF_03050 [Streptosporangiaceae bacterium]